MFKQLLRPLICACVWVLHAGGPALAQVPCLSGFVTDAAGQAVVGADLDMFDPVTGVKLVTPGDNTDAFGFYSVCVLPGTYDVAYGPPPRSHLLGKRIPGVDLNTGRELSVVLDFGLAVHGRVQDPSGLPVGFVDIDVDSLGGGRVYTPNDNSDPVLGEYWVVVPAGIYRLRFEPPPGSRLRGLQLDSVMVAGDVTLDATLPLGSLLSGTVTDPAGRGAYDIEVDLRDDSTGAKIYVANNESDSTGAYTVAVPDGVFELRFTPPRGSHLVGALIDGFLIQGDRTWNQSLASGARVVINVQDSSGQAIADADIDFKLAASGLKVFTPHDNTDATGTTDFAVRPDVYTIQVDPPPGSAYDRAELIGIDITTDTTLNITLPEVERVRLAGTVVDSSGAGIPGVELRIRRALTGKSVFVGNNLTDPTGQFELAVPVGRIDVLLDPPVATGFAGYIVPDVSISGDTLWQPITLVAGHRVVVQVVDDRGLPLAGADLDFVRLPDGIEAYTPGDNTDTLGATQVILAPGTYRMHVDPPPGTGLTMSPPRDVTVDRDITLYIVLGTEDVELPSDFILHPGYPNPFNAGTTVRYSVLRASTLRIDMINILGRRVRTLREGRHTPGFFAVPWDGHDESGRPVASGIYFATLSDGRTVRSQKLLLLR